MSSIKNDRYTVIASKKELRTCDVTIEYIVMQQEAQARSAANSTWDQGDRHRYEKAFTSRMNHIKTSISEAPLDVEIKH